MNFLEASALGSGKSIALKQSRCNILGGLLLALLQTFTNVNPVSQEKKPAIILQHLSL